MKKVILIVLSIALLQACTSPESVSKKALRLIGLGTFKEHVQGIKSAEEITMFSDYNKVFTDALISSDVAEAYRTIGYLKDKETRDYFVLSQLFDNFEFVSKEESYCELYGYTNYSELTEILTEKVIERLKKADSRLYYDCEEKNNITTYRISKNETPLYILRYKIDNKQIAAVIVVDVPKKGCRVGGFYFE